MLYAPLTDTVTKQLIENPGLYPVDGVGMGLCSISRRVIDNWDHDRYSMWKPTPPIIGHDLQFCWAAAQQGFRVYLDTGLVCGHEARQVISYRQSQAALAEAQLMTWQEAIASGHSTEDAAQSRGG